MLTMKYQAETSKAFRFLGIEFVRTADFVSELKQKAGNSAHAAPGHANQMNAVAFSR